MAHTDARLEISPDIIDKFSPSGGKICFAGHSDGSDNRIDGDAILDTAGYSFSIASLQAGFMWLRKKFRNRGKTKEDFAAEKEAAAINQTCIALKEMLLEYLRSAREGEIDEETLGDLIKTLEETDRAFKEGKLVVPDAGLLTGIREKITTFTDAIVGKQAATPSGSEFSLIREQLIRQRDAIF
ncbi:MAG: hypothetical protein IKI84_10870 [Clostridia bacterium]|nr:hypothetical protein [Clostridia bacterium]